MNNLILTIEAGTATHPDDLDQLTQQLIEVLKEVDQLDQVERVKRETATPGGKSLEEFIINQIVVGFVVNIASQAAQPYLEQCGKVIWQWTQKQSQRLGREVSVSLGSAVISSTMTWLMVAQLIDTIRLQKGQ